MVHLRASPSGKLPFIGVAKKAVTIATNMAGRGRLNMGHYTLWVYDINMI